MSIEGFRYYLHHPNMVYAFLSEHGLLNWLPDKYYVRLAYRLKMGKKLNLNNPQSFNEKMQWLKLYCRKNEFTQMVDKYEAKLIAGKILGDDHTITTLGVWDSFDEIDFDALPNQFVLKCTHDSGGLVICRDKKGFNINAAKNKIEKSLHTNFYLQGREWPYKDVKPRIIAEEYMTDGTEADDGLTDYKFFCFNAEPKLLYVSQGLEDHTTAHISFYDLQGKEMPFHRNDFRPFEHEIVLPNNFSEMVEYARQLAEIVDNPFVRIDLYSIKDTVYFSEFTFSPCGGMIPFSPPEWDEILGRWLTISDLKEEKE